MFWGLIVSNAGLLIATIIVIVGLFGEYTQPGHPTRVTVLKWSLGIFPWLVVVGVVGELIFDGAIFATSLTLDILNSAAASQARIEAAKANDAAAEANKIAGIANEAAGIANELAQADRLKADAFEAKYGALLDKTAEPRDVDEDDLRDGMKGVSRGVITIIRLDDLEPRNLADKLALGLAKLNFKLRTEDLHTAPLGGVVVCQHGSEEAKVVKGLNAARLGAKLMPLTAPDRPAFCDKPVPGSVPFGAIVDPDRGTVIFVGQRPLPPQ